MSANPASVSPKSAVIALLLSFFLGMFGAHRFYLGKMKTAVLMLVTLGGLGIWAYADLIIIACGEATDGEGRSLQFSEGGKSSGGLIGRILAIVFGFLPMSFLIGVLISLFSSDGMTGPVNRQLAAIRAGDMALAYSYTSGLSSLPRLLWHFCKCRQKIS